MKNYLKILVAMFLPVFLFAQVQQATLLGTWSDDENILEVPWLSSRYNEVWGFEVNGHEYAVIGSTMGAHIIDVTDPTNPFEHVLVDGAEVSNQLVHRDYHTYEGYLYAVADEGLNSTLQIIDISNLPDQIEVVYDSNEFIVNSHNIFIDESQGRLYSIDSYGPIVILDLSNPFQPQLMAEVGPTGNHDIYVKDHIGYLNEGNAGLSIIDFTDPNEPKVLGTLTEYPHSGYNHSGWLDEEGRYYFLLDETHGTDIKTLDVCNPADISVVNTFNAEAGASTSIPHNTLVFGNRLFVSYYYEGLQVFDITDPSEPVRIYEYDTYAGPDADFFAGAWGVYPYLPSGNILVSDLQTGLYVFEAIEVDFTFRNDLDCDPTNDAVNVNNHVEKSNFIAVYPHPASDIAYLDFESEDNQKVDIVLYDLNGRISQRWTNKSVSQGTNNIELNLSEQLPNGLYFIQLQGRTQRINGKLNILR